VTVAESIELEDRVENLDTQLVKEAARRTREAAGDGGIDAAKVTASALCHAASVTGLMLTSEVLMKDSQEEPAGPPALSAA
jgi:chaperonin GroEL (HSP60 family)